MGWSLGYDSSWQRDIGYGVPAYCDHPTCHAEIHRGLSYVCGGEPYGGDRGCGLYFCSTHLDVDQQCPRCRHRKQPYTPKPEHPEWLSHKRTHESWAVWRAEHPNETAALARALIRDADGPTEPRADPHTET